MNDELKKIEQIILGTIMVYGDLQDLIVNSLIPDMFYDKAHKLIFKEINKIHKSGRPADMLTVSNSFKRDILEGIGGTYYISVLTSNVGSAWDYENGIKLLKQEYIKREMVTLFQLETAYLLNNEKDISDIYSNVNKKLEDLFSIRESNVEVMFDVMNNRLLEIEKIKEGQIIGISSGVKKLDSVTNGWQDGDMIILAARPSMGKTIISNLFAKTPALEGKTVLYFSLEMPSKRIADRIISLDTGINSKKLQSNNLYSGDWIQIEENVLRYKDCNFLINDESGLTIEQISNIALIESKKNDIDIIMIDYMQLINSSFNHGSTNDKVTHISKNIKALAKKLKCPVIALSQLNRESDKRSDKRPVMSDLRDSGSIEQDADIIIFLYRDDAYDAESPDKNQIELLIRKNRNGEIGMTKLYRNDSWSRISDEEIIEIPDINEMPEYNEKF